MSDKELKSTIAVSVDGKGVEVGVAAVKKSLESMGAAAASAGVGFNGVATQADEALKKADRSTKAFVAQVKNAATDVKAELDKLNIADKFELKAVSKGLDPALYKPYVDYLRTVVTEQDRLALSAAATGNSVAMSARAMSNAMRGVPAQFTDIVTSLTSGQAPLTVLMQQGGQLKDMFGGVGNAFKALGSYVVGLISPVTLLAAGVAGLAVAYNKGASEADAYNKALILTGNAVGTTSSKLSEAAANISRMGVSQGAAAEALAAFASTGQIAAINLERFSLSAVKYATATGIAVEETVKQFTELGKAPLEASIKLDESANHLTLTLYQQIKALDEQGRHTEAANLAQNAFADTIKNRADEMTSKLGYIEQAWAKIKKEVNGAVNAMANIGREDTFALQISKAESKLKRLETESYSPIENGFKTRAEAIQQARDTVEALRETERLMNRVSSASAQETVEKRAQIALDKEHDKYLDKAAKAQREISAAYQTMLAAPKTAENTQKYVETVKGIIDKYKDKTKEKTGLSDADKGLREYNDLIAKSVGLNANFTEEWDKLSAAYKAGKINVDGLTLAQAELLREQKFSKDIVKALAAEVDDYARAEAASTAAHVAAVKAQDKRNAHLKEQIEKQREDNAAIGLSAEAVGELEKATLLLNAAELERKANLQDGVMRSQDTIDGLREQAKLMRELAEEKRIGGAKKAANEAYKEWQKAADKINESITDALMRGFESGKSFAENLRDTVVNMFKTMVLRPTVSAIVNPVAQGITGALGLSGAANAAGAANTLTSAGSLAGGITAFGGTLATGFMNTLLGSGVSGGLTAAGAMIANGAWASGLGMAAGALGPVGLGIAALSMIGNKDRPTANTGNAAASYDRSGNRTGYEVYGGSSESVDKMLANLQDTYTKTAQALGIGAAATRFAYGGNTGKNGESPNFALGGQAGGKEFYQGETTSSDAAISLAASRAVFAALQGSDLPAYLSKMFDGLNAASMTQEQISNTLAYAQSIKQVRDALLETREPLQILKDNVAQGFAALGTSAESFKTDFVAAIDAGITPTSLAQWQGLQTAMNDLATASGKASDAVKEAGRSIADIATERQRLQDRLDELTMTSAQLLDKQRNAIDSSNRALFDQVQAQEAVKAATDAATSAAEAMAERVSGAMASLSDTRAALQAQLLTAQGDPSGALALTRKTELDKLIADLSESDATTVAAAYAYNTALEDQIKALNDAKAAAEAAASAQARAASEAQNAADQIRRAWQSITDSIFAEVQRIRGLMGGGSAQSFAQAQAKFTITAAQASAGDQEAAKLLPALSQTMLTLAEAQATTLAQLRAIQGRTAGALESVGNQLAAQYGLGIPKLATGTNMVPQDMLAMLHKGEAVVPAVYNPVAGGGQSNSEMAAELREVRALLAEIRDSSQDTAKSTRTTEKTIVAVTEGGTGMLIAANSEIPVTVLM